MSTTLYVQRYIPPEDDEDEDEILVLKRIIGFNLRLIVCMLLLLVSTAPCQTTPARDSYTSQPAHQQSRIVRSMRKHPALYGIAIGAAAGIVITLATRHTCPSVINGYPYSGTAPCPNPATYDPTPKRK